MSFAVIHTRARVGVDAPAVTVETHLSGGLPSLSIVGMPEAGVRESKDRVRSALLNSGFDFPARRITINLAPADLPKEGSRFDLPIALGILAASGQVEPEAVAGMEFLGELALDGSLRPLEGILPAVMGARGEARTIMVPAGNAADSQR
jgi:magnesium chelatase family protein